MRPGAKRTRNDSDNYDQSSDESDGTNSIDESQKDDYNFPDVSVRPYCSQRKPRCFSKNAQMARENRLKKKIYVAKLEKEVESLKKRNFQLSSVIDNQSLVLSEFRNEIRYLKGVIANSSDIAMLLKNINVSTGMSVSTSLNLNASKVNCASDFNSEKRINHPWQEKKESYYDFLPETFTSELCDNLDSDYPLNSEHSISPMLLNDMGEQRDVECDSLNLMTTSLAEHNYTRALTTSIKWEALQTSLPLLHHQRKVMSLLVEEIRVYQDEYSKKMYRSFFLRFVCL